MLRLARARKAPRDLVMRARMVELSWSGQRVPAMADELRLPSPADLREAFLWSEFRTVTKTATVSLHGNTYEVDPMLTGM
ncbi:hypothetical protein ACWC4B_44685, partial [Streptomyces sp. NPDC001340]